jgi:hypothetical protein
MIHAQLRFCGEGSGLVGGDVNNVWRMPHQADDGRLSA